LRCNPNLYGYASSPKIYSNWTDVNVAPEILENELKKNLGIEYILVDLTLLNSNSCQEAVDRIEGSLGEFNLISKSNNGRWEFYSVT
jgi:hypothetical protein